MLPLPPRPPADNFRSPAALFRFYGVCTLGLALDLATKTIAHDELSTGRRVEFIPGYLHFEWVMNHGAVFGIGEGQRSLFVVVSIVALGFLNWLFAVARRQPVYQIILGMLLAGVLGNLYDRIVYGYVRDMLHALPGWTWPWADGNGNYREVFPYVFNIADVMLCTGVGCLLIHSLLRDVIGTGDPVGGPTPPSPGTPAPTHPPGLPEGSEAPPAASSAAHPPAPHPSASPTAPRGE